MIIVDPQGPNGQAVAREFVRIIHGIGGVRAEIDRLPFGDFAFEGYGGMMVGVERKTLHNMLMNIDDSQFTGYQRPGMRRMYQEHWLLLEGMWKPREPEGTLMEGNTGGAWWNCRPGGRAVLYSKLRRYLFSIQRSGTPIVYTRDVYQTAFDLVEMFHYYGKRDHTSQLELQKRSIPSLNARPSLTMEWATALDGVGLTYGRAAEKLFKTPIALATSEELEWMSLKGIGEKTARDIVAQIQGAKRGKGL